MSYMLPCLLAVLDLLSASHRTLTNSLTGTLRPVWICGMHMELGEVEEGALLPSASACWMSLKAYGSLHCCQGR